MKQLHLEPVSSVEGAVTIPGSKSLSNRALLLAALSKGKTTITNLLESDDTHYMLEALKALGVSYTLKQNNTVCEVVGHGGLFEIEEPLELYLGNAGTAMRPLCAALTFSKGAFILTGEPRMKERPIAHLVEALRALNVKINYLEDEGYPPLKIDAKGVKGGTVSIDGSISSQFLTALLMAAPLASEIIEIEVEGALVSKPYIAITLDIMQKFGVRVEHSDYKTFTVQPKAYSAPSSYMIEGDASSASYFLAAAAIKGGSVTVKGIGKDSIQGDKHFADMLALMGAKVVWESESITVSRGELHAIDVDCNHIPDAAMTLATTALFAKGTTRLRNIYNWRVKETDRLLAMATELRKVGAIVEEGEDYLCITPPAKLKRASIDTYNDHRMAMCFSLLALGDVGITINEPECVNKTFPSYFDLFNTLCK